jgi:hydrogenase maturation protease
MCAPVTNSPENFGGDETGGVAVIGYGSDLRGDDAVGRMAAEQVEAWALPDVEVISTHQLLPELAMTIAGAGRVIFIDAHPAELGATVSVREVFARAEASSMGHTGSPASLLALAETLYESKARAWLVTIPAQCFELGAPLSPATSLALKDALRQVRMLLENFPAPAAPVERQPKR